MSKTTIGTKEETMDRDAILGALPEPFRSIAESMMDRPWEWREHWVGSRDGFKNARSGVYIVESNSGRAFVASSESAGVCSLLGPGFDEMQSVMDRLSSIHSDWNAKRLASAVSRFENDNGWFKGLAKRTTPGDLALAATFILLILSLVRVIGAIVSAS